MSRDTGTTRRRHKVKDSRRRLLKERRSLDEASKAGKPVSRRTKNAVYAYLLVFVAAQFLVIPSLHRKTALLEPTTKPNIVVTTHYGGLVGKAWERVTRPALERYCSLRGYLFLPWDDSKDDTQQSQSQSDSYHKWMKIPALYRALSAAKPETGWAWWTDADVLLVEANFHNIEELIQRTGQDTHVILLRRRAVTSSNILVRNSKQGRAFVRAWEVWKHRPRDHEKQWVDQGVLNDMLFERDGETIREEWCDSWASTAGGRCTAVVQIDCLCTDLNKDCKDWWCEGLYPANYNPERDFAIHAAGCRFYPNMSLSKCVEGLEKIYQMRDGSHTKRGDGPNSVRVSNKTKISLEPAVPPSATMIYGITVTRTAAGAAFAAADFFAQRYSQKRLIVVTNAPTEDLSFFQDRLSQWNSTPSGYSKVILVHQPPNTRLGALRQAGMNAIPSNDDDQNAPIYVQWDDDDIRHPDLLLEQSRHLGANLDAVVLLNQQIQYDARRNASICTGPDPPHPSTWHGIAGTIMGRYSSVSKLRTYPPQASRHEDSVFLQQILDSKGSSSATVWENPPHWYIRISHTGLHASGSQGEETLRASLNSVRDNEWRVQHTEEVLKMLKRAEQSMDISSHPPQQRTTKHPPVFVLTLPSRQADAKAMVRRAGLNHHLVHFVDGVIPSQVDVTGLMKSTTIEWNTIPTYQAQYPLSLEQIASHLGHIHMLQEFEKSDAEYAVFLEDGASLPLSFDHELVRVSQTAPKDWEMINLGRCFAHCELVDSGVEFSSKLELCRTSYMVHRRGLPKLLMRSLPMMDTPGDRLWHYLSIADVIKGYALVPRIVSQNRNETGLSLPDIECRENALPVKQCPTTNNENTGWKFCGRENSICVCPEGSSLRFGCGDNWSPLPSEPSILATLGSFKCDSKMFGNPIAGTTKICQCKAPTVSPKLSNSSATSNHGDHTRAELPKSPWCVVLTGTVRPQFSRNLFQTDPAQREATYYDSLWFWKKQSGLPVLFIDNSDADLSKLRTLEDDRMWIVQVPFTGKPDDDKGPAERDAVFNALDGPGKQFAASCDNLVKITGRFAPMGLDEALHNCPTDTRLVVQKKRVARNIRARMESQMFGWHQGNEFEQWYREWQYDQFEIIEEALLEQVRHIGNCNVSSTTEDVTGCQKVCFVGPLALPEPVTRGGFESKVLEI